MVNPVFNTHPGQNDFSAGIRKLLDQHAQGSEKLIPAKVVSFDRKANTAMVQPMIMLVDTDNNTRLRNSISEVPVVSLGGGGFHISFPIKPGDLGWILAADRDISLFMQNLSASRPNTMRKHTFADSWFIPDVFRQYTINSEDDECMVIQTTDAATRISIDKGKITITAPTSVKIDTPIATFTKDVHIQGNVQIDQNLNVTGLMQIYGGFNATAGGNQPCTLPQDTTIGGIMVYGHGHIQTAVNGQRTSAGMVS